MDSQPCDECKELTITVLTEPDARPLRLNARAVKAWRLVQVSPSHPVGMPVEVHEPHSLTCKAVNRT